jgi:hypothetical protein
MATRAVEAPLLATWSLWPRVQFTVSTLILARPLPCCAGKAHDMRAARRSGASTDAEIRCHLR